MKKRDFILFLIMMLLFSIVYFFVSVIYIDMFDLGLFPMRSFLNTGNIVYFILVPWFFSLDY